jgi:hypothetical protein
MSSLPSVRQAAQREIRSWRSWPAPGKTVRLSLAGENDIFIFLDALGVAVRQIFHDLPKGQEDDGFPKRPQILSIFFIPSSLISPINNKSRFTEPLTGEPYTINPEKPLKEKGYSIYKISKDTGFTKSTIKQYLSPDFNPVNAHYGNRRNGILSPYRDEIIHLRSEGKTYGQIVEVLREKGYTGTEDAIRGFVTKERRIAKDLHEKTEAEPSELIERKWLIKLLFKPLSDVKGITEEQFKAVIEKYPAIKNIYDAVSSFKKIVFSKKVEDLSFWMAKTESLGIDEINSFINGLKKDIVAVKNAITLEYNNGLAEGSVNKLKVIKRIMYGRNKFELLRNKVLMLESLKIN